MLPFRELGANLIKQEFRTAVKLQYDWPVDDITAEQRI